MKRTISIAVASALLSVLLLAPQAKAAFALHSIDATFEAADGSIVSQAGSHPFGFTTAFGVNTVEDPVLKLVIPDEDFRDLRVIAPPGLVADRNATPTCSNVDFVADPIKCSDDSAVGVLNAEVNEPGQVVHAPVYSLTPPPGVIAKIGFKVLKVPVTVELSLSQSPPYNGIARLTNTPQAVAFYSSELTLWGNPADPAHNDERGNCAAGGGDCPAGAANRPFLTLPRSCTGPLETTFEATSWQGGSFEETIETKGEGGEPLGMTGCSKLGFAPSVSAQPTSGSAESATGLDFGLDIADEGLTNPAGLAHSDIKEVEVTLPEGMTINPSQAEGLGVCSEADLADETVDSEAGEGCPQSSKIGSIEVESPLLQGEILKGALFVATPHANLAGDSLIAFYVVIKSRELGILVKQPARVEPDPQTGQLITTTEEMPQLPFSHFRLHFNEGARSPLVTPPTCGTHTATAKLTPWANPSSLYSTTASFEIDSGVSGGPCPSGGTPPFEPGFEAGTLDNRAGGFSPFTMRLTRRDGDQDMTKFSATLPPGMVAKLAGTTMCSDASIEAAKSKTGKVEQSSPSCPASSQIGTALGGAGVGSQLTYVPGKIYLAGPHKGAPLSVVAIVPAVAGPFDVGNVVVQQALRINPRTAIVTADGASSDPLPHILAGIPLRVRDIRVYVDKPSFTLNPTSCEPSAVAAQIFGGGSNAFSALDDSPLSREARFQAADCASLGFKPRLELKLKGGTKRGSHPALKGTYTPREGDANLEGLVLRLPRSAFLDQAHIRTICTRVQFAANGGNGAGCPAGAVYGQATAYTPILDQPLTGSVYLRSSDNNLPDFVAALHGLVDVEAVARIDSIKGGIRASFEDVPDAPLSKVVVSMQGGAKGLIVNSTDLCAKSEHRANAQMAGQNGRRATGRPAVRASCGKGRKASRRHRPAR